MAERIPVGWWKYDNLGEGARHGAIDRDEGEDLFWWSIEKNQKDIPRLNRSEIGPDACWYQDQ